MNVVTVSRLLGEVFTRYDVKLLLQTDDTEGYFAFERFDDGKSYPAFRFSMMADALSGLIDARGPMFRGDLQTLFLSSSFLSSTGPAASTAPIMGSSGDDQLTGTQGDDVIQGLAGDDVLEGLGGADTLDGGDGVDFASYENATSGVNVKLVLGGDPNTGDAAGDTLISIENLRGSAFNDLLFGDDGDNRLEGGAGDDTLYGWGGGTNYLFGGDGVDNMVGSSAIDIFDGGSDDGEIPNDGDTVSYQLSQAGLTASLRDQSINTGDAAGDVYTNMEDLTGTDFDDVLHGDDGELNNLWGLAGDDHIIGYGGTDVLIGDAGADILDGGEGDDIADYETADAAVIASLADPSINTGHAAGDTYISVENLAGSLFDDQLYGDEFNNVILGWPGNDQVFGGEGDDGLEGMGGADFLDGGDGIDTVGYSTAGLLVAKNFELYTQLGVGVRASFLDPSINTNDAAGDSYANVENLQGSTFDDFLEGDNNSNTIFGLTGDDELHGADGDDVLEGGKGGDFLRGGAGTDIAAYSNAEAGVSVSLDGSEALFGDSQGDTFDSIEGILGSSFDDVIAGDAGFNILQGADGNDTLRGRGGDDLLDGGAGADTIDGGDGVDVVTYENATTGLTVYLQNNGANTGDAAGDILINVEVLQGSRFNDILHGFEFGASQLRGGEGDDQLIGGAGDDILIGGAGADQLVGGAGVDIASYILETSGVTANMLDPTANTGVATGDTYSGIENLVGSEFGDVLSGDNNSNVILGQAGNDQLFGNGGDDGFEGGSGADFFDGGEGVDTVGYSGASAGVRASFLDPSINTNDAAGDTFANVENLQGSTFADILEGDNNSNTIFGLAGDDELHGAGGDDTLEGGAGADFLRGGAGIDIASYSGSGSGVSVSLDGSEVLFGDSQGDTFESIEGVLGSAFSDVIAGDAGFNILQGADGNDTLRGRGGDDLLDGGAGADTIDGGDGVDVVTYENATTGLTVYLQNNGANTGDAAGDILINVEVLQGSRFNDILHGFEFGASQLRGGEGDDQLIGGAGDDILIGGAGADQLVGGAGSDLASYVLETAPVTVYMGAPSLNQGAAEGDTFSGVENLAGTDFGDVLGGDENDNVIFGRGGDDTLLGGGGDDSFEGGDGSDFFDGGEGIDVVSYANEAPGVTVFMADPSLNQGAAVGDTYTGIENLIGTSGGDTLGGTDANNVLFGELGNDALYGGGGDDLLEGGAGADFMDGQDGFDFASYSKSTSGVTFFLGSNIFNAGDAAGDTYVNIEGVLGSEFDDLLGGDDNDNVVNGASGNDYLIGADGNDFLVGGSGNDVLFGGLGNDLLDGGEGDDVAYYREAAEGVTVNLLDRSQNTGEAAGDDYVNIENVWVSDFNDTIIHDNGAGQVYGFNGDDILRGNGGNDAMYGGRGADTIAGGEGADTFLFMNWNEDEIFFGNELGDTIEGFESGVDQLFVSRFFFGLGGIAGPADSLSNADPSFVELVTDGAATGTGPAFLYDSNARTLSYDPDGAGDREAIVMATFDEDSTFSFDDLWSA